MFLISEKLYWQTCIKARCFHPLVVQWSENRLKWQIYDFNLVFTRKGRWDVVVTKRRMKEEFLLQGLVVKQLLTTSLEM